MPRVAQCRVFPIIKQPRNVVELYDALLAYPWGEGSEYMSSRRLRAFYLTVLGPFLATVHVCGVGPLHRSAINFVSRPHPPHLIDCGD
jgi:hypothetical protein